LLLENQQLRSSNQQLQNQNTELKSQIDSLQKQIELQQQKIDYLLRQKFSPKSEQLSSNQLSLFADVEQKEIETLKEEEKIEVVYTRAKGNKKRPPKELERVEVIHDIDEDEKTCKCGCQKVVIAKEITEQYDVVPAKFQVIQHVRLKYGCPNKCEAPKLAPLAPQLLPRHQVSPRLIATIVTQKFEDHLPLHRQAKIFSKRFGVKFNSTTLSDWVIKAYNIAIAPLLYLMQSELNKSDNSKQMKQHYKC
jgi:transposase